MKKTCFLSYVCICFLRDRLRSWIFTDFITDKTNLTWPYLTNWVLLTLTLLGCTDFFNKLPKPWKINMSVLSMFYFQYSWKHSISAVGHGHYRHSSVSEVEVSQAGVNFTNILQAPFWYENILHSFSLITVWLCEKEMQKSYS